MKSTTTINLILDKIIYKAGLAPDFTARDAKIATEYIEKIQKERKDTIAKSVIKKAYQFELLEGKRVDFFEHDSLGYELDFFKEFDGILKKFKQKGILKDFMLKTYGIKGFRYELVLAKDFEERIERYSRLNTQIEALKNFGSKSWIPKKINSQEEQPQQDFESKKLKNNASKKELIKITIVTPTYGKFDYLWVVFNEDHENKTRVLSKSKNGSGESYAKQLFNLAKSERGEIYFDKTLIDYLNYGIWKNKPLRNIEQANILKQQDKKTKLVNGIKLETKTLQQLSENEQSYYPKTI